MKDWTRNLFERIYAQAAQSSRLEQGLVNIGRPGHTRDGSAVAEAHCGPTTANLYAGMAIAGRLDASTGAEILGGLDALQIRDEASPYNGCFYWYSEERDFHDSNAAFFVLSPLVVLRLKREDAIPQEHKQLIDRMFRHACGWFRHELQRPKLYYPNKILSDGAMLLAIARQVGDKDAYAEGVRFFEQWLHYTGRRGWGWGENLSLGYIRICLNALKIACLALQEPEQSLREQLAAVIEQLLDIVRFHHGRELVPTIRTYNFTGQERPESMLWWLAGVYPDREEQERRVNSFNEALTVLLYEEELDRLSSGGSAPDAATLPPVPRIREERVFDEAKAYSWIGGTARLGSVSRFPVIAGSYQWPTWGLGWQSMPVASLVHGEQASYLRWYVDDGEEVRTHPAYNKARAYLASALFSDPPFPNVQLRSAQCNGHLLVIRSMSGVHNVTREIADEWVVHRFTGRVHTAVDAGGHPWTILQYPHAQVLVAAIASRPAGGMTGEYSAVQPEAEQTKVHLAAEHTNGDNESGLLRLRQLLYRGETKLLREQRIEAGWAICVLDDTSDPQAALAWLGRHRLHVETLWDNEEPREHIHLEKREIQLLEGDNRVVALTIDPHETDS